MQKLVRTYTITCFTKGNTATQLAGLVGIALPSQIVSEGLGFLEQPTFGKIEKELVERGAEFTFEDELVDGGKSETKFGKLGGCGTIKSCFYSRVETELALA